MNNLQTTSQQIALTSEQISQINAIAKEKWGISDLKKEEIYLLHGFLNEKGFSVFSNDFYIVKYNDYVNKTTKNTILTSIEGVRKLARRQEAYSIKYLYCWKDGTKTDFPFKKEEDLLGVKAILKKLNGTTIVKDVLLSEYKVENKIWKSKTFTMIIKVAEMHVLRASFDMGGIYIKEEFDKEYQPSGGVIEHEEEKKVKSKSKNMIELEIKIKNLHQELKIQNGKEDYLIFEKNLQEVKGRMPLEEKYKRYINYLEKSLPLKEDKLLLMEDK